MKYDNLKLSFSMEHFTIHLLRVSFGQISWVIPMHNHSENCYEIHYITSGRGNFILDGKTYEAAADMLFIAGPLIYHEQLPDEQDPMAEYCINICIEPNDVSRSRQPMLHSGVWQGAQLQDTGTVVKLIYRELSRADNASNFAVTGILQYLLVLLSRLDAEPETVFVPTPLAQQPTRFCMIEDAIMFEYRDLTLEKLAERLGLSIRQTERLLKKNYGSTFRQMKTKARMAAAATQLLSTNKPVSLIAEEAGYTSAEHFCRAFKNSYGVTIREYRGRRLTR